MSGEGRYKNPSSLAKANVHQESVQVIVACDFMVAITSTFRILYIFLPMEIGARRIVHLNGQDHTIGERLGTRKESCDPSSPEEDI